jgi:CBS domain containing-hemolysin-like protein
MTALIAFFLLSIVVSFICSLMEAVLLSLSRAYIGVLVEQGKKSGRIMTDLKNNIDKPLSAILTMNTIAHTLGAAGVGAQTLKVFGNQYVAIASAVMTFAILVLSEIIPKTIGAVYRKQMAAPAAYIISFMIVISYPFVLFLKLVSALITRKRKGSHLTRDEILMLAQLGKSEGVLHDNEITILRNLLHLDTMYAKDVLTPRAVIVAFNKDETVEEIVKTHNPIRFSKILVYDHDIDNILGFVYRSRIIQSYFDGNLKLTMEKLTQPIYVIPQTKSVAVILDEFIKRKEHIFLVVDEYGGTEGIITLEDAIETLLGAEIVDELDTVEDMRQYARTKMLARKKRRQR